MTVTPSRDEEIRLIWKENQWLYMVVGFIAGLLFCLLAWQAILNLSELVKDLLPEAAGILVTITVIDQLNRRRDTRNAIKQLQEQLVRDASSSINDVANNAVHQLQRRDWLRGDNGLLFRADLSGSNLQEAYLGLANLQGANLMDAKLQGADLRLARLQGAQLSGANLQGANISAANLKGAFLALAKLQRAKLSGANLQGANLRHANLQGAQLQDANLRGASLTSAEFDEATTLPDDTQWTPDTDMTRFTQPDNEAGSS